VENLSLRLTVENREAELEELQSSVRKLKSSMAQRDEQVTGLRRTLSEVEEAARERERSLLARLLEMKREIAQAKRMEGGKGGVVVVVVDEAEDEKKRPHDTDEGEGEWKGVSQSVSYCFVTYKHRASIPITSPVPCSTARIAGQHQSHLP
jgi:multidrug resistance efflux pump